MAAAGAALWFAQGGRWTRRGVLAGAASFIPGVTIPTPDNIGLSNPALLTDLLPNNGGYYEVTANNTTIENKRIKAHFKNSATGTVLRNCLIDGLGTINTTHSNPPVGYVGLGLVDNAGGGTLLMEDCVAEPAYHQWWINALRPGNGATTIRRTRLAGGTDAINFASGATGSCLAEDVVLGPQAFCNICEDQKSSSPAYWTHNDGVQIQSLAAKFVGRNIAFLGRAVHPNGDLSVLTAASGYADASWGSPLTYSGPAGLTTPAFDIDRGYFTGGQCVGQASTVNAGMVGKVRNSSVSFADSHLYGTEGMYHFRATTGASWDVATTGWSAACGSLSRTLNGTTYTRTEGELLTYATQGMSQIQLSLAGVRNGEL